MQRFSSFNSPSSPSVSASNSTSNSASNSASNSTSLYRPVADSTDQKEKGHHSPSNSLPESVPTLATPSTTTTSSTTKSDFDTNISPLAAATSAVGDASNKVTISGRATHDSCSTSKVPAWRQDFNTPQLAFNVPSSDSATSFSTTGAIHQSSLSTVGSPRGLSASTRGLPQSPIPAKRPSATPIQGEPVMHPSPIKKARTGASPPRKVDLPKQNANLDPSGRGKQQGPLSPLFFSHTPARHVHRPASFPATDPAVSMLSRMREDPAGGVTTLKLPRASVSSISPGRSESTPGSWGSSMDVPTHSATPDSRSLPPGLQMLQGVGVIEFLEQDERPTFLIDLDNSANASRAGLHILYYNASLRSAHEVLQYLSVDQEDASADTDFGRFKSWITTPSKSRASADIASTHIYAGITWTLSTLRRRFRFVSAHASFATPRPGTALPLIDETGASETRSAGHSPVMPVTPDAELVDAPDYFGDTIDANFDSRSADVDTIMEGGEARLHPDDFTNQVFQSQPARSIFDWTRIPMSDSLPPHIKFARSVDWAATPLGPIEDWPADLRSMSNLIMGSPHPAAMYWGPQYVIIYNEAYLELAGKKHPKLMGACYMDAWSEIWDEIKPVFKSALESGQATMKHENQLFINRHGFLEETFFSWSIVPLVGGEGEVVGLYNPAFENTRRRVNERRMLMLREIGERTAAATTVSGFWPQVLKGLEFNEFDVPFALIYSAREDTESEVSSLHSGSLIHSPQLFLEASLGAPENHPAAVDQLDMRQSDDGFVPYMRQSMAAGGVPIVLSEENGNLPTHLIDGLHWRGFGDPSKTLVVFPVIPTTAGESVIGFIVMGVNPRRPYDDDYKLFIHLLSRQLATSMASVVLFEEEIKRGQRAARLAALDRQELSMQLYLRTQEAVESEYRFTRMAEFAPVGMFIANFAGKINYCNDMWWQISRHSRSEDSVDTWMDSVRNEDRPTLEEAWSKLLKEKTTISVEFRFKCSQQSDGNTIDTWVLMSAYPEKNPEGNLKLIFGCITDISSQKWAEKVQNERREEAVEMKRQQENFIDITSHEMRNPLSAILQCADQIANNITVFNAHAVKTEVETLLDACLDAANTINLCASHQKRIVDDILTLSKLDSNLLAVTPIDEQPVRVVQHALKMFESELIAHDIEFNFNVDKSFEQYGIKWVKLDPSRLRQVLINLMTNAIKFTQGREKRSITVSLSASKHVSEVTRKGISYFERVDHQRTTVMNINNLDEWGHGEEINLHCTVEDTGPGLIEEEMKLLFQRFQQATPRTHVQYGGSGLGLFISRILTEMQGGQIGVTSRRDVGSSFSFYIKCRRSLSPPPDSEPIMPIKIPRKSHAASALPPKPEIRRQVSQSTTTPAVTAIPTALAATEDATQLFDVLIVEDNIVNQKVLQRQLRNCGNNTFVANHGKEALQTLERSRFWAGKEAEGVDISVILMDLEMPVMDGMTCARRIRELEREGTIVQHIPIIAVTAYARPEQIESAKAAGIDDVISKPFRIPELLPKIEELVGKYKNLSVSN
ncbi:sensory transduction histidine kinase [Fusarium heterosporum]|uniref:Sensory transduction histidine kinase n=1 Tax=Fusarium heterosporum TaxID=42747 RepID=A0A8H5T4Y9_FUSHE|nr:sensory transduction histidine kinase [Fusarium heterosporum]